MRVDKQVFNQLCKAAVCDAEAVLDSLGLQMTMGGEIEWYAVLPPAIEKEKLNQAIHILLEKVRNDPYEFKEAKILGFEVHAHELDAKLLQQSWQKADLTDEDAVRAVAENVIQRSISGIEGAIVIRPEEAALRLLRVNVALRAKKEGIPIHRIQEEIGIVCSGGKIAAKQLEISTGVSNPATVGEWIEQLKSIIQE